MKIVKWAALLLGIFILADLVLLFIRLQKNFVKFTTINQFSDRSFSVSTVWTNTFLYLEGYRGSATSISVTYSPATTPGPNDIDSVINGTDNTLVQSFGYSHQGTNWQFYIKYNPSQIDYISSQPHWFDKDLMAYLCLALDSKKPTRDECYKKAASYFDPTKLIHINHLVTSVKRLSLNLIKTAYAALTCTCSSGDYACSYTNEACGTLDYPGTCYCYNPDCPNACASSTSCKTFADLSYVSGGSKDCDTGGCGTNEIPTTIRCTWNSQSGCLHGSYDNCSTPCLYDSSCQATCSDINPGADNCGGCSPTYNGGASESCCSGCRRYIGYRVCTGPTGIYNAADCTGADPTCGSSCGATSPPGGGGGGCNTTTPMITSVVKNSPTNWLLTWTPGANATKQEVFVGDDLGKVADGCPFGAGEGTGCAVDDENVGTGTTSYDVTDLAQGTVYYYMVEAYEDSGCSSSSTTYSAISSCDAAPGSMTIKAGSTQSLVTSVNSSALITSVNFSASSGFVSLTPTNTSSYPYSTNVTGESLGSGTVTSTVNNTTSAGACIATSNINVNPKGPWWQVKDGDVTSNGDLTTNVMAPNLFGVIGTGGYTGVPSYSGTTDLTASNVSVDHWFTDSSDVSGKTYGSAFFSNAIPAEVATASVTIGVQSVPGSTFASGGTAVDGIYWYQYDGSSLGDLTINSAIDLGGRTVVLFVKNANLIIDGSINYTHGSGLFMVIVTGNISVGPAVGDGGGAPADLEGVYVADGQFITGSNNSASDKQLWIRGVVAAYGGFALQRDLGPSADGTTPSEVFEFAPELDLMFPSKLAAYVINWREVAP
jgi:hypothetical protein